MVGRTVASGVAVWQPRVNFRALAAVEEPCHRERGARLKFGVDQRSSPAEPVTRPEGT